MFVGQEWAVVKCRRGKAQRSIKEMLARRGNQQISAPYHFRHHHGGVIHYDSQLIGRYVVMPPNHEVSKVLAGDKRLRTHPAIQKGNLLAIRRAKAPVPVTVRVHELDLRFGSGLEGLVRQDLGSGLDPGPTSTWINGFVVLSMGRP